MALEDDPVMVSWLSPKYDVDDDGQRKAHQEVSWYMQIKVDGFEGFGDMPLDRFAELIRSKVEAAAYDGLRHMRKNRDTLPQYHLEQDARLDIEMKTERLVQFETEANPFIGVFQLEGRAVVDATLPISAEEGLLIVQRRIAQDIAARVARLALSDHADE